MPFEASFKPLIYPVSISHTKLKKQSRVGEKVLQGVVRISICAFIILIHGKESLPLYNVRHVSL